MKISKLILTTVLLLSISIQTLNAQRIDVENRVEYSENDVNEGIEDLSSIKSLAHKKKTVKKKQKLAIVIKKEVKNKPTKKIKEVKEQDKQEMSLEDFVRKVSQRSKSLRFNKKRKQSSGKCYKEVEEGEEDCGSNKE